MCTSPYLRLAVCIALYVALWNPVQLGAQQPIASYKDTTSSPTSRSTAAVFRAYSNAVLKIQVLEKGSSAKASLGTGFFVSEDGLIVTNYHVISQIVNDPKSYRADATDVGNTVYPVEVVAFDVIHDLAILRSRTRVTRWFSIDGVPVDQGERLYSMGHPHDLGLSVVEGTYNGLLAHTLYPKIHFTGSINSGMSGGPAITANGNVIGINVASSGDGIGFLVPVNKARELLARAQKERLPTNLRAIVARQIRTYQDAYLRDLFLPGAPTTKLGRYTVPTRPAPFFKCWADVWAKKDLPYRVSRHDCSTDDVLFIFGDQESGLIEMEHRLVTSNKLMATQFAALMSSQFSPENEYSSGTEEDVTKFSCTTKNVSNASNNKMRVAFCSRAYKKLPGLYDAVIYVATLGIRNAGMISTLRLSGVTFANAKTLTDRYIRSITWTP